jgi:CheY-like chemotaxis protein
VGLARLPGTAVVGEDRQVSLRVLIVDDSPQFRAAAAELLADRGFEVLSPAADGREALAAAAEAHPDGMLLDINLPGTDGFEVASAVTAACPGVRIVLDSASVTAVPDALLRACGAIAFLCKEELEGADLAALFTPAGT